MTARLTERDSTVLRDAWLYRYVTSEQVARLHFGSLKVAQRRLRKLTEGGFLDRFHPEGAGRRGFRELWYRLARPGARIVAEAEGVGVAAVLPPLRAPKTLGFLAHHRQVTDFRIWLREACQDSHGFRYEFIPSYEEVREARRRTRRASLSVPGLERRLVPDGVFTLKHGERAALFFLEVDRGTEPVTGRHASAVERKLTTYRAAYEARGEEKFERLFQQSFNGFRVLCIVSDQARLRAFVDLAHRVDLAPLVWTATSEVLEGRGRLDAEQWSVTTVEDVHALTE